MHNRAKLLRLGTIAADTGRKFSYLTESIVVALVVTTLVSLAIRGSQESIMRAQLSDAFMLSATAKVDILAYRSEYGRWPATADKAGNGTIKDPIQLGRYVRTINLRPHGAVEVVMGGEEIAQQLLGTSLSLRFVVSDHYSGAPVAQVCGGFPAPPGMHVVGKDHTTIEPKILPFICKEH